MLAMTKAADREDGSRTFSSRASVLFNGDWTDDERRTIEDAVLQVDAVRGRPSTVSLMGRAWVCNCHVVQGVCYYMAHWSRRPGIVLTARTATDLGIRMARLADESAGEADA